jgi:hypothetical protein
MLVRGAVFVLEYCERENMVVDILTKPMTSIKIVKFREAMGIKKYGS